MESTILKENITRDDIDKVLEEFIINEHNKKKMAGRPLKLECDKISNMKEYMKEYNKEYYNNRRVLKDKSEYKKLGRPKIIKEIIVKEIIVKPIIIKKEFVKKPIIIKEVKDKIVDFELYHKEYYLKNKKSILCSSCGVYTDEKNINSHMKSKKCMLYSTIHNTNKSFC